MTNWNNFESADALADEQFLLTANNAFEESSSGLENNDDEGRPAKNNNKTESRKRKHKILKSDTSKITSQSSQKKIKRTDSTVSGCEEKVLTVKLKKKKPENEKKLFPELSAASESQNERTSIGIQPPELQLDYLIDRQKRGLPGISDLELESLRIELDWIQDVTNKLLRAQMGSWLKTSAIPELLPAIEEKTDLRGAPVVLVVASSALRVIDLCREVKPLIKSMKESGEVAKLFARHIKLKQHMDQLNSAKTSIGVGTPDRIAKLMDCGALKLDRLKWMILDVTWTDSKDYSLTELPDKALRLALWNGILGFEKLTKKFRSGRTKLVLF
ncbi:U3-containing 90S pre-ribosomal complex subunit-domain containing protein [Phakopsora pachyrhizi]|nr:U3-containing 90S pre-ribosomal complex subunit-domain containing protein [Phakopsora pachyrhizi]